MFSLKCLFQTLRHASLVGILLLAGMNILQPSASAQSEEQRILSAYFNAGYGYCDAQMLGAFWGQIPFRRKF